MTISNILILAFLAYVVITFGVLPVFRRNIESNLTSSVLLPYARYHLFAMLQTVSLATAIGAVLTIGIINYLGMRGSASIEEVSHTLEITSRLRDIAAGINVGLIAVIFALITGGLAWLSFKQAKQQASKLFEDIREEERKRVIEAYENDQWEELPPSETMAMIDATFQAKKAALIEKSEAGDQAEVDALKESLDTLQSAYVYFDIERRLDIRLKSSLVEDLVLPASARLSDRIRNALLNRGTLKSLQGMSKVLVFLMLIALLPAATTLDFAQGLPALEETYVTLDQLRVTLARDAADHQLKQALAVPTPVTKPAADTTTVDDDTAVNVIASAYDQAFTQHLLAKVVPPQGQVGIDRAAIREQILRDFAHTSPHKLEVAAGTEVVGDLGFMEDAKKKFRQQLEVIRHENKAAWQAMKASIPSRADFSNQLTRSDLKQALTGEILRTAFPGSGADISAAYHAHGAEYLSSLTKGNSFEKANESSFGRKHDVFWTAQAEDSLRTMRQQSTGEGELFDRAVRDTPPTLRDHALPAEEAKAAERILQSMPARTQTHEALLDYQDLLPGRLGDEMRTPAAKLAESIAPKGGAARAVPKPSRVAFQRSFSYHSLRGFSRVGGVLIGSPPANGQDTADIVDISWASGPGDTLTLTLVGANGSAHKFGPYPTSIVRQALVYAADQRPLAVTMITAKPVPDLKIIAHPALIDTALGCRAIMLDRIADEATSRSEYRTRAHMVVEASNKLYQYTWGYTVQRLVNDNSGLSAENRSSIERIVKKAISDGQRVLSREYPSIRSAIGGSEETPVTAKKAFYDAGVAEVGINCAKKSDTFQKLESCIQTAAHGGDLESLISHYPEFQIWSGVRELPYKIDKDLGFLRDPGGNDLWPFDFVLQTAFTRQGLIDDDEVRDDTPWEFPALHQRLVNDVHVLVKGNSARRDLVKDMRQFAVVQRLFRVAMNGQMGQKFPIAKLGTLSHQLNAVPVNRSSFRTPRWNTHNVEGEYAMLLMQIIFSGEVTAPSAKELVQSAFVTMKGCSDIAYKSGGSTSSKACNLESISKAAKQVEDDPKVPALDKSIAEEIRGISGILQLRRTLGVHAKENLGMSTCPAL